MPTFRTIALASCLAQLVEREMLKEREVEVQLARAAQNASAGIAKACGGAAAH